MELFQRLLAPNMLAVTVTSWRKAAARRFQVLAPGQAVRARRKAAAGTPTAGVGVVTANRCGAQDAPKHDENRHPAKGPLRVFFQVFV